MDEKYLEAVKTIKTTILRSQSRTVKYINFEAWQPYLQTTAEFLPEGKSVAAATDLEDTGSAGLTIAQNRLPTAIDFPMEAFTGISWE